MTAGTLVSVLELALERTRLDRQRRRPRDLPPGDAPASYEPPVIVEEDAWTEARMLADTIEDHELIDPMLSAQRLLIRLFHERGVRAFAATKVKESCQCSRRRIMAMLGSFSADERREMIADDGMIEVTCEFCSTHYRLAPGEVERDLPQAEAS